MRISLLISLLILSVAPQTPSNGQSAVTSDPQALTVLVQMASATGWSSAALPQDATATGAIQSYGSGSPITVNAVYKSRGPRLFRADVQQASGTVTTVLNGDNVGIAAPSGPQVLP